MYAVIVKIKALGYSDVQCMGIWEVHLKATST